MDYSNIPSPSFVLNEKLLRKNLELIKHLQQKSGAKVIVAFKGFAMWSAFPLLKDYIDTASASSLNEARLCNEEMNALSHVYSPAYLPEEFDELMQYTSHIVFNSQSQYHRFFEKTKSAGHPVSCGFRVNPEFSTVETDLYNPSAPGSRLGICAEDLPDELPEGIEGLHFHVLCESSSFDLAKALDAFETKFGKYLHKIKWVNMGGGHLMTRKGYDVDHLIRILKEFRQKHNVEVILEPGSAIAWETGDLVSRVLDIVTNKGIRTAILDVSFAAHMPDTLEMPYRPVVVGTSDQSSGIYQYRLGGISCLAGDYMEIYNFEKELIPGDQIIFKDMIHYTMVKTTTFNGVKHPDIAIWTEDNQLKIVKQFSYEDFKYRLS